jgi:hypothetical protein
VRPPVRYWHLADIPSCAAHVRFREESGHALLHCKCLLMTQSGIQKKTWTLLHGNSKRGWNRIPLTEFCRVSDSAFLASWKEQ